jgi:hypothetical protein
MLSHLQYWLQNDFASYWNKINYHQIKQFRRYITARSYAKHLVICICTFFHRQWLQRHDVSKADWFRLQACFQNLVVCVISDDGNSPHTYQWYLACDTIVYELWCAIKHLLRRQTTTHARCSYSDSYVKSRHDMCDVRIPSDKCRA